MPQRPPRQRLSSNAHVLTRVAKFGLVGCRIDQTHITKLRPGPARN